MPIKRADGHILIEAHGVDLSDGDLCDNIIKLSRFRPPLHRHGHVHFKTVGIDAITTPNAVVRNSDRPIELFSFFFHRLITVLVMLGTFAPELEREAGILLPPS